MDTVQIVEVGLRDGFQSVNTFVPTETKIDILQGLYKAGVRRVEASSFVSQTAVPQLADAADIVAAAYELSGFDPQVLVPNARYAERALQANARHIAFVLSVSDTHNQSNVRRSPMESVAEYAKILEMLSDDIKIRLNVATAFDCPFEGKIKPEQTLAILESLLQFSPNVEVALCDTTGRVTPTDVHDLFVTVMREFPAVKSWVFHGHDTFGMGVANVLAAWNAGVRIFDASISGLGGCPFAPGATGNVATEDLIWMFNGMSVETAIDLDKLVTVAEQVALLPDAAVGGRVRHALRTATCIGNNSDVKQTG